MEKLTQDEMKKILEVVGEETSGSFTQPKAGAVEIKKLTVIGARDQTDKDGNVTHINAWVRVDFKQGGSCSLRSLLISPNITWTSDKQADRIEALRAAKNLEWQFIEPRTSKAGNPYKVAHVKDITL